MPIPIPESQRKTYLRLDKLRRRYVTALDAGDSKTAATIAAEIGRLKLRLMPGPKRDMPRIPRK